jgi:hypothetical protein
MVRQDSERENENKEQAPNHKAGDVSAFVIGGDA